MPSKISPHFALYGPQRSVPLDLVMGAEISPVLEVFEPMLPYDRTKILYGRSP